MSNKNSRGFTLVELIAIIGVLAIIALTTYPVVGSVINKGRDRSYESQVNMIEDAATSYVSEDPNGIYENLDAIAIPLSELQRLGVVKKTKIVNPKTEKVMSGCVKITKDSYGQYKAKYQDGDCSSGIPTRIVGEIIYYNPVTNSKCTSGEVNTVANAKTGCLKWNVITVGDTTSKTTIDIMLDHSTTAKVAWNSSGYNTSGMKEVATALTNDTSSWNATVKGTARLISGQEVANIVKNTGWTTGGNGISLATQSWLYQNLSSDSAGYWTSTAKSSESYYSWIIFNNGYLTYEEVGRNASCGVRPVITVSKSNI